MEAPRLRVASGSGWHRCRDRAGCLIPVFVTFDMPLTSCPSASRCGCATTPSQLAGHAVVLTVPFAVSGSTQPMLWQAVDDMHFRLAGAA